MPRYVITIEETVSDDFNVRASSPEEAIKIAIEKYKRGELVLEPGFVTSRRISAAYGTGKWYDF